MILWLDLLAGIAEMNLSFQGNKMRKNGFTFLIFLLSILLFTSKGYAGELKWEHSAVSAFFKAMSEKKKIVLFVGRDECGQCRYMRTQVFESEKPAVKNLLKERFVLWFGDVDQDTDWRPVAHGLSEIPLPLICLIDPDSGNVYEDRTTGIQHGPEFYARLLKHASNEKKPGPSSSTGMSQAE